MKQELVMQFQPDCLGGEDFKGGQSPPLIQSTILDTNKNNCPQTYMKTQQFSHNCNEKYHNFYFQNDTKTRKICFKCRQWGCEQCNYNKKWNLKFLIENIAHFHQTRYFITLTMPRNINLEYAQRYFSNIFMKFRKRYQREYAEIFKFIRITELHKDGYPHFHLLTHQRINVNWLRKTWVSCGGGKIMKLIYLQPKQIGDSWETAVSKYLSKYFSKSNCLLPKGFRHYTTNYKIPPNEKQAIIKEKWDLMVKWDIKGKIEEHKASIEDFGMASLLYERVKLLKKIENRNLYIPKPFKDDYKTIRAENSSGVSV